MSKDYYTHSFVQMGSKDSSGLPGQPGRCGMVRTLVMYSSERSLRSNWHAEGICPTKMTYT
jgi:hypothetical protein